MASNAATHHPGCVARVLHLLVPSRATAVGEAVVALAAVIAGTPLPVHVILAIIVDLAVHVARRHGSPAWHTVGRLK